MTKEGGRSSGPVEPPDRARAEDAARLVYEAAGLAPPKHYIWLDSPLQGTVCVSMIPFADGGFGSTANSLNELIDGVDNDGYFEDAEDDGSTHEHHVKDRIWESAMNEVMERLKEDHGIVVDRKDAFANAIPKWGEGDRLAKPNSEANAIGLYEFFANEFSSKYLAGLEPVIELTKHCGWWWPYQNAVILTERPKYIKLDDAGGIGAFEGPALEYRDGWKINNETA